MAETLETIPGGLSIFSKAISKLEAEACHRVPGSCLSNDL